MAAEACIAPLFSVTCTACIAGTGRNEGRREFISKGSSLARKRAKFTPSILKTPVRRTTVLPGARPALVHSVHVVDRQRVRHAISVSLGMSRCLMLGNGICRRCHVREDSCGYRCHHNQGSQSCWMEETLRRSG